MPVKRRAPKGRRRITPEAVASFEARDVSALQLALSLGPWMPSPLDVPDEIPDYVANDDWKAGHYREVQELRRDLLEASGLPADWRVTLREQIGTLDGEDAD